MPMIQLEKPFLTGTMPVLWPTILDLGRDECKRILRKLELEAYAGVISALRAQGDLTKDKKDLLGELTKILGISTERHRAEVRRAVNDERLTTIAYHMSGPNSASEWSIEGRRLVPLMPRLVPQTAFTMTANAVASATANQNASLLMPAETGNKEVVVCYSYTSTTSTSTSVTATGGPMGTAVKSPRPPSPASNVVVLPSGSTVYVKSVSCSDEDEKPRKRRRTNSSSSSPVVLKEVSKVPPPTPKTIAVPGGSTPKMSNIMQSIANSLPHHLSPVKITFTKPTIQSTNTTTQKVIIVTTSPSSNFVPNILSKSHPHGNAPNVPKLVSTSMLTASSQKQTVVFPAGSGTPVQPNTVAVTAVVSSSPSVVMSTVGQCGSSGMKMASARHPSPKALMGSPTPMLAQFPKQQSPKPPQQGSPIGVSVVTQTSATTPPGCKSTIQIKQEPGVKIISQQMQPSKILPKPSSGALQSSSSGSSPIMVVSSNGAIMTTKLLSQPTATQATYTRPTVSPGIGARISATTGATYVKTTSGSIITVVPKSLATLGGKIISSNIVSGTTTKITTIPMTSKPNVIVVQKTTGKGATIQGLPGKNVVTTLLNAGGEKALQAVQGGKPALITASRPITKMIVTQPKGVSAGAPATTTKIIPTKIVYGQQGKTQVLIKPKPVFQTAVVSEQTRQLVSEALQQVSRSSADQASGVDGLPRGDGVGGGFAECTASPDDASHDSQPVVHLLTSREQEWAVQEVSLESHPAIIYQEQGESHSATSTIKALLELQQSAKEKVESKPRQHTIDLSQMAVPLQLAQEKRHSPETSRPSTSDAGVTEEYVTTGKGSQPCLVTEDELMVMSTMSQLGKPYKGSSQGAKAVAAPSPHLGHSPADNLGKTEVVLEAGELEGDTLDPQTGLFYRSSQSARDPPPQPAVSSGPPAAEVTTLPMSQQHEPDLRPGSSAPPPPPQLQSKPQLTLAPLSTAATSSSSSAALTLTKKLPKLREQPLPTPQPQVQALPLLQPQPKPQPQALPQPQPQALLQPQPKPQALLQPQPKPQPQALLQPQAQALLQPQPKPQLQALSQPQLQALPLPQPQPPPKPQVQPQSPSPKERPTALAPGMPAKPLLTLPRLQQAPTSLHRPIHTPMSQPPPLQAHHPVGTEKTTSSQQPIITQSATVTKITFGGSHHVAQVFGSGEAAAKPSPPCGSAPSSSYTGSAPSSSGSALNTKPPSVSDILKISMMEAEIDPSTEPMVVDSSSDHGPLVGGAGAGPVDAGPFISSSASSSSSSARHHHAKAPHSHFGHVHQRAKEDIDVIEVIPQYAILPDSSQSNVVVEPSGFLEITNYTSQQLEDDSPMEQEVDSSNDEATAVSPMEDRAGRP